MARSSNRDLEQVRTAAEHLRAGRMDQALSGARKVLSRSPGQAQANQIVATVMARRNMVEQAVFHAERAAAGAPQDAIVHTSLGQVYIIAGRFEDALAALERAIALDPDPAPAHIARGTALKQLHRYEESIDSVQRGIERDPEALDAWINLATAQLELARADEAVETLRRAVRLAPDNPSVWTLMCPTMNYASGISADEVYAAHRRYGALIEKGLREREYQFPHTRDPDRVLRVGYISRDMRRHSCAYFLLPILRHHDPERVESYCYSHSRHVDDMTDRIREAATVFRDCSTMSDEEIRQKIMADRIDILVELSGHSGVHKLPIMARRPAPVQATYLGYPHTTGLQNIQYRVIDELTDPPDAPAHASEELWRLPRCFLAYDPPEVAPESADLPALHGDPLTFGSFNEAKKISDECVSLWARMLQATPGSRLLLKAGSFADPAVRARVADRFKTAGIASERLEILGHIPSLAEHLALYGKVDLALDTFPYHGTTTTCEAMWMGVPTVTLRGDRHASRVGSSLNHAVGLDELTAGTHDQFVDIAQKLSGDPTRLAEMRRGLRERVRSSPLCDHVGFTRDLEHAYRVWWQRWCASGA